MTEYTEDDEEEIGTFGLEVNTLDIHRILRAQDGLFEVAPNVWMPARQVEVIEALTYRDAVREKLRRIDALPIN